MKYEFVTPSEENSYCIFKSELEENPLVLFHLTPKRNFESIISKGFRSAAELKTGEIESVSYAKRSSGCFANKGNQMIEDVVVFAVEFDTLDKAEIMVNCSDILVYNKDIQPAILGYCELQSGFKIS